MINYICKFAGRKSGALGNTYYIQETVVLPELATFEEIRLKLYDKYERISELKINGMGETDFVVTN